MNYIIRNDKGIMIAKAGGQNIVRLLSSNLGSWKTKSFVGEADRNCFIIKEDGAMLWVGSLSLYLWEGYYLYEDSE